MNNLLKNLWLILSGLLIILTGFLIVFSAAGPTIVIIIVSFTVLIYAMKQLWLYLTMARFMVGGMNILFKGIIALDFAIFLFSINKFNSEFIMLYLIIVYFASGAIDLFRALEIKKLNDHSWKLKAIFGVIDIIIAFVCIAFIKSPDLLCFIYGCGIALKGIKRMGQIFVKNEMVYIQ